MKWEAQKATVNKCRWFYSSKVFTLSMILLIFLFPHRHDPKMRMVQWHYLSLMVLTATRTDVFPLKVKNLLIGRKMSAHCCSSLFSDKCINTFLLLISVQNLFCFWQHLCWCQWGLWWEAPFIAAVCLLPACLLPF